MENQYVIMNYVYYKEIFRHSSQKIQFLALLVFTTHFFMKTHRRGSYTQETEFWSIFSHLSQNAQGVLR